MKNYIGSGEVIPMVAPAGGVVGGTPVEINDCVVVPISSTAAGADFQGLVMGLVDMPKASIDVIPAGRRLFWDNTNKRVSLSNAAGNRIGFAQSVAGSGTTTVRVMFYAMS